MLGGGPAGCSAALTAHSLGISALVVEKVSLGSRVSRIPRVANLLGGRCSGEDLVRTWACQISELDVPVVIDEAVGIEGSQESWIVRLRAGDPIRSRALVVATGTRDLFLREHPLIGEVDHSHEDVFLDTSSYDLLRTSDTVIVGCDRPLLTLLHSDVLSGWSERVCVLALPDRWYVIRDQEDLFPVPIIRVSQILSIKQESGGVVSIEAALEGGGMGIFKGVVVTNLGNTPNSDLVSSFLPRDSEGYLVPGSDKRAGGPPVYVAGDVAHRGFQRIGIAIGEGMRAALAYFYEREGLSF